MFILFCFQSSLVLCVQFLLLLFLKIHLHDQSIILIKLMLDFYNLFRFFDLSKIRNIYFILLFFLKFGSLFEFCHFSIFSLDLFQKLLLILTFLFFFLLSFFIFFFNLLFDQLLIPFLHLNLSLLLILDKTIL